MARNGTELKRRSDGMILATGPNPATESIRASFDLGGEGLVRWRVLDMSGRVVLESSLGAVYGMNNVDVPLTRVDAGSYLFEVSDDSGLVIGNMRFVKQ
ncbi:MAG: T9SS type A sorting domain-containing protein [Flavobacteriales bacterium]